MRSADCSVRNSRMSSKSFSSPLELPWRSSGADICLLLHDYGRSEPDGQPLVTSGALNSRRTIPERSSRGKCVRSSEGAFRQAMPFNSPGDLTRLSRGSVDEAEESGTVRGGVGALRRDG